MTTDPESWYYDERTATAGGDSRAPGYVWTYGIEVWCNLEGQYVHIVADLSHLTGPYTMSLCSVGIMGTSFERNEPLPNHIELAQGESIEIPVPYIFDEHGISTEQIINLRQAASAEFSFVTIYEKAESSTVHIDSVGLEIADYELHLESFDTLSTLKTTLKTDIIIVSVTEPKSVTLTTQFISPIESASWDLDLERDSLTTVQIEPPIDLARFISYNDLTDTLFFDGSQDSGFLAGSLNLIKIKLTSVNGAETILTQAVMFQELPVDEKVAKSEDDKTADHQDVADQSTEAQSAGASNENYASEETVDTNVETYVSTKIDQEGRVVIIFSNPLENPEQLFQQIVEGQKSGGKTLFDLEVIPDESDPDRDLSFSWSLIAVSLYAIEIQLSFAKPFEASQGASADILKVQVRLGELFGQQDGEASVTSYQRMLPG